jgi:hypothetical protein
MDQGSLIPNLQLLQVQIDQQKELVAGWEERANIEKSGDIHDK